MSKNKIDRLIEEYELTGIEESLVRDWTHEDDQRRKSVRELTSWFNQKLVMVILDRHTGGMIPSDYTVKEITTRLHARGSNSSKYNDIPDREIMDIVQWLQNNDVPVENVIDDFVSYGTMYTYLKEIRGAVSPDSQPDQRSPEGRQADVLEGIRTDLAKQPERINSRLRTLRTHNQLPETKPDIHISVECNCPACGYAQPIADYIEHQGCTECEVHTRDELTPDQTNRKSHADKDENTAHDKLG
jgi:broad-specificity NMP kinase